MTHYAIKVLLSAAVIVAVSEIAKRSSMWAAMLASLPLTSLLAFVWLYRDTGDTESVAALAQSILWLVLPSLLLFVALPLLLRAGVSFWTSLALASALTAAGYLVTVWILGLLGVRT